MDRDLRLRVIFDALDRLSAPLRSIAGGSRATKQALAATTQEVANLRRAQAQLTAFKGLETRLRGTNVKLEEARQKTAALRSEIAQAEAPTNKMRAALARAEAQEKKLTEQHEKQGRELQDLGGRLERAGADVAELHRYEDRLANSTQDATRRLAEQRTQLERIQRLQQRGQAIQNAGGRIMSAGGRASLFLTAPLLALGAAADGAATQFETSMSNVSTLIDNNVENIDQMGERVLAIGRRMPKPIVELGDALYQVRSAGISANDQFRVLEGSGRLAVAGLGQTSEAVDLVTSSINAFNLHGREQQRVYDIIFRTVRGGKTTVAGLAQGFGSVAPQIANAGVKLDEYLASVSAMTALGAPAAQVHTQIRAAVAGLTRETTLSKRVFRQLGATTFRELVRESGGMVPAFTRIRNALHGNDAQMIELLGSTEAYGAMIALTGTQNRMFTDTLAGMRSGQDQLNAAFDRQQRTRGGQRQMMRNQMFASLAQAGDRMLPALSRIAEIVAGLAERFSRLSPGMQETIIKGLVLAAALGPVVTVLGATVSGIGALVRAFAWLRGVGGVIGIMTRIGSALRIAGTVILWLGRALMLNPIGLAITAIAVAAYLIWTYWDEIKAAFFAAIGWLGRAWQSIRSIFSGVGNWISGVWRQIGGYVAFGVGLFLSPIQTLLAVLPAIWRGIMNIFSSVGGYFAGLGSRFYAWGQSIARGLANGIRSGAAWVRDSVTSLAERTGNWFRRKLGINSPSRVFMQLGNFVTEGLGIGIDRGAGGPIERISSLARRMTAALAIGAAAPALAAGVPAGAGGAGAAGGRGPIAAPISMSVAITINAPGGDPVAIRRAVEEALAEAQRRAASAARSSYDDD
ncbi:MAG: phage tail tape measure protein [Alphaproteobacteria bacterium]|nr:MAG: phage tail tape measure protein [Alphaproteobacteria bacterium]